MRYEKGHKDLTRQHILNVASRKFRKEGIAAVGLAGLMKEAGLTNGAFYAHFKSKEDLIKNVLMETEWFATQTSQGAVLPDILNAYLSPLHRDTPEKGCLSAALISELVQHSRATRLIYSKKIEQTFAQFAEQLAGSESERDQQAIAIFSTLLGALQLSRAVTDKKLSEKILISGRDAALSLMKPTHTNQGVTPNEN